MKRVVMIIGLLGLVAIAVTIGIAATPIEAADHLDAPLVSENGQIDINDIYVFQSPNNPDNTVLIMTVNPLAGVQSPTTFRSRGPDYEFHINNQGSFKFDAIIKVNFGNPDANQVQKVVVKLVDRIKRTEKVLFRGVTGENIQMINGDGLFHAGVFDDPFFFDLLAFRDNLNFCPGGVGANFFDGLNVSAIALEIPSALLVSSPDNPNIGVWGFIKDNNNKQIERMGRPAINTVLIPSGQKDEFNRTVPSKDQEKFRDEVVATLLALGNSEERANQLADILLPDILTFDTSSSAGFLNGRRLNDDVIDAELNLLTNGAVTTDCVGNDSNFSNDFPYLAPPN
jgi:hypothetical protein